MRELEGRAEALAGLFNAQDVANTLWAYATMGREPGAGMMRELEGRAEALAGTFSQLNSPSQLNVSLSLSSSHDQSGSTLSSFIFSS